MRALFRKGVRGRSRHKNWRAVPKTARNRSRYARHFPAGRRREPDGNRKRAPSAKGKHPGQGDEGLRDVGNGDGRREPRGKTRAEADAPAEGKDARQKKKRRGCGQPFRNARREAELSAPRSGKGEKAYSVHDRDRAAEPADSFFRARGREYHRRRAEPDAERADNGTPRAD